MLIVVYYSRMGIKLTGKVTSSQLGYFIRQTRRSLKVTQKEVAALAGTGPRFIIDLEHGKATCELQKVLEVINILGIQMNFVMPSEAELAQPPRRKS